ncbi:MAG: HepT-like ribonuclease domain-containing protein [Janthinobacterium lividum]
MSPQKDRPRDPDHARHRLKAARLVVSLTQGRTFQNFLADELLQSGIERQFEILGEASSHISIATQALWPSVEWKQLKNFCNLLAHEYFRTDYAQVWNIATNMLPNSLPTLEALFIDLDQQFGPDARV